MVVQIEKLRSLLPFLNFNIFVNFPIYRKRCFIFIGWIVGLTKNRYEKSVWNEKWMIFMRNIQSNANKMWKEDELYLELINKSVSLYDTIRFLWFFPVNVNAVRPSRLTIRPSNRSRFWIHLAISNTSTNRLGQSFFYTSVKRKGNFSKLGPHLTINVGVNKTLNQA